MVGDGVSFISSVTGRWSDTFSKVHTLLVSHWAQTVLGLWFDEVLLKQDGGTGFFCKYLKISGGMVEQQSLLPLCSLNPLNAELNPICYLLALLGAHHFLHVSRIRVKQNDY